ncbi:hypothetical protein I4U23_004908 [Adineta vaga]|nr:hypothetical protein I4U23_004908 [Adineta vaga]
MALVYQLAVFIIALQSVYTLKCYVLAADNSGAMVMTPADSANMTVLCNSTVPCACASYKMKCGNNGTACTIIENQQGITKWVYMLTTKDMCTQMAAVGSVYMSSTCCYTDLCNNQTSSATSSKIFYSLSTLIILLVIMIMVKNI